MKTPVSTIELGSLIAKGDLKPTIILLSSVILLSVHRCFGSIDFCVQMFGTDPGVRPPFYMFGTAFLLLGITPLLIIRTSFHEPVQQYGLRLGDWKFGVLSAALLAPVIALTLLYPASQTDEIRSFYPFARIAATSWPDFLLLEAGRVIFFYTSWEFFFRGFMLFGLREHFGAWPAVCIQVIPQCLWHIGMPTGELISSIAAGVLFGVMALRTGSILWPYLLHCFIGVCTDLMVVLTSKG